MFAYAVIKVVISFQSLHLINDEFIKLRIELGEVVTMFVKDGILYFLLGQKRE